MNKPPAPSDNVLKSLANVETYIQKYSQDFDKFKLAAAEIEQKIRLMLSTEKMPSIVSSRAKDPARLKKKLDDRINDSKSPKTYLKISDIEQDIVDIVGTRVVLYLSYQANQAAHLILSMFVNMSNQKDFKFIKDSDTTSTQILTKLSNDQVIKSLQDKPPATYTMQMGDYKPQLGSYRATHIRLNLSPKAFSSSLRDTLGDRDVKVEIQVQGLLMHAWSEVSHDILYKPLSGRLSNEEYRLLDCLNGVGKLGESILLKLKEMTEARQKEEMTGVLPQSHANYLLPLNLDDDEVVDDVYVVAKDANGEASIKTVKM